MFCAEVTAPVMMCTSASRRTPLMPTGSLMPSWSSTMNSCGMTWIISRSTGMATACAASTTRLTSAGPISLSLRETAMTPRLLMLRMWSPAMPATTPLTGTPAMRSASSTARVMLATVFSRSTTTPRRNPSLGALPTPTIRSSPLLFMSATMHEIFVVPMSSPTCTFDACAMRRSPPSLGLKLMSTVALGLPGIPSRTSLAGLRHRVSCRGAHDHLMLIPQIDLLCRNSSLAEGGQHHPERRKCA